MIRFTAKSMASITVGAVIGVLMGAVWAYHREQLSHVTTKEV